MASMTNSATGAAAKHHDMSSALRRAAATDTSDTSSPSGAGRRPSPGTNHHRPILAERFRTKMCKNHVERGECPYVHRCMFAHGESELRTTEQNVADRLFSEDAIRAFKRYHYEQRVRAQRCALFATPTPPRIRRHDPYALRTEWHPLRAYGPVSPASYAYELSATADGMLLPESSQTSHCSGEEDR